MVEVGDTEVEPDKAIVRLPGLMVTVAASDTDQFKVTLSPASMFVASAVKEWIMGLVGVPPLQAHKNRNRKTIRKSLK